MNNLKFKRAAKAIASLCLFGMIATPALADQIEGNWTTASGETAVINSCGSSFCITITTGEYSGKEIGKLSIDDGAYSGTILDPSDDNEYSGSAIITGSTMQLKGCAMIVFCDTQTWQKQ